MPEAADRHRNRPLPRHGRLRSHRRSWLVRTVRRAAGAEHNPLVRPLDRARSVLALTAVLLLAGALLAGCVVSLFALHLEENLAARQQADRRQTTAVTSTPAYPAAAAAGAPAASGSSEAKAAWTGPDGHRHSGAITVPDGTLAPGAHVRIWINSAGDTVSAPTTESTAVTNAALVGSATLIGASTLAAAAVATAARMLNRRAAQSWEQEWSRVEPDWSGRRPRRGGAGTG